MTSSLIASAMMRDPLYHIECLTVPSYTKYLISSRVHVVQTAVRPTPTCAALLDRASLRRDLVIEGLLALRSSSWPDWELGGGRSRHLAPAKIGAVNPHAM